MLQLQDVVTQYGRSLVLQEISLAVDQGEVVALLGCKGDTAMNTVTLQAEVPSRLFQEIERLVQAGWSRDIDTLVGEALRRFLESRRAGSIEEFIRQDVEWGLHGRE